MLDLGWKPIYTDMSKWYENRLRSAEDDHAQLILFLVGSQFEAFIGEEETCHIDILKKNKVDINEAAVL